MQSHYEQVKNAWRLFVDKGIIDKDVLRPEIADSWVRCYKDKSLEFNLEPIPAYMLKIKQEKNKHLIETARPVMQDIFDMMKDIASSYVVALFDNEGDIIDLIDKGNDLIQLGVRCNDINGSTGAIAIALKNDQLTEVSGYEHLFPLAHNFHSVAAAIHNYDHDIAGVLAVVNMTGSLPAVPPMVFLGTKLIDASGMLQQVTEYNSPILNIFPHMVVSTDEQGRIIHANQKFLEHIEFSSEEVSGQYLKQYLFGSIDYNALFSLSIKSSEFNNVIIKHGKNTSSKTGEHTFRVTKRIFNEDSNYPLIVLIFQNSNSATTKKDISIDSIMAFNDLIGESSAFFQVKQLAQKVAHSSFNVLIQGESGTGKEMIAQAIHKESGIAGPFVAVNCGAIPRELMQSELFGYVEGAFTGAKKGGSKGKFELADGGTLFLDEIGEMPLDMQVSLLRFLQDRIITPVGGNISKKVAVRFIAATNRALYKEVQNGNFREDLYYRLNVIQIDMPPLRDRREDIPLLANHILKNLCQKLDINDIEISQDVLDNLCCYSWPGNVRELHNVMERSLIYANSNVITLDCLPFYIGKMACESSIPIAPNMVDPANIGTDLKSHEMCIILESLKRHNFNITKSAQELGIVRSTLYKKMAEFGINRSNYITET